MTNLNLKQQAIQIIQDVPDDKIFYVINILKQLSNIFYDNDNTINTTKKSEAIEAWEGFQKYIGIIDCDIDAKAELAEARDEKYARFN